MTPTLPNDIVMRIIREADGGLNTHKKKMSQILEDVALGTFLLTDCDERANDEDMWMISTLSGGYLYVPIPDEVWEEFSLLDETMYEKNKSIASLLYYPENANASWMYSLVK